MNEAIRLKQVLKETKNREPFNSRMEENQIQEIKERLFKEEIKFQKLHRKN